MHTFSYSILIHSMVYLVPPLVGLSSTPSQYCCALSILEEKAYTWRSKVCICVYMCVCMWKYMCVVCSVCVTVTGAKQHQCWCLSTGPSGQRGRQAHTHTHMHTHSHTHTLTHTHWVILRHYAIIGHEITRDRIFIHPLSLWGYGISLPIINMQTRQSLMKVTA